MIIGNHTWRLVKYFFGPQQLTNGKSCLSRTSYKEIILDSLQYLSNAGKIDVFGFVIMPTHIHLIWRTKELNGKETAQGSFLKYTAHEFRKILYKKNQNELSSYQVDAQNKAHEFWQRDSLAILLYSKDIAFQKLGYIHFNPVAKHWQLAKEPCEYKFSSAAFYDLQTNSFPFLKDLRNEF